jgi:hypothetical protein
VLPYSHLSNSVDENSMHGTLYACVVDCLEGYSVFLMLTSHVLFLTWLKLYQNSDSLKLKSPNGEFAILLIDSTACYVQQL